MKLYQVDAFTDRAFSGNSAAVCLMDANSKADIHWMQDFAMEMNLSETAFLVRKEVADENNADTNYSDWGLRWFTPGREVELCGHATLASAHILFSLKLVETDKQLRFHTRSGILRASIKEDQITLDFPSRIVKPFDIPEGAAKALGVSPSYCGAFNDYVLVELDSAEAVESCSPDFGALEKTHNGPFIITAASDDDTFDFISRFFAPAYKIDEDPVTGSAHCMLGTYWGEKLGKKKMKAFQASSRGGVLDIEWEGDRMYLSGRAVTIFSGELEESI
jgi:PhzF family phenazine biosynthesis protein